MAQAQCQQTTNSAETEDTNEDPSIPASYSTASAVSPPQTIAPSPPQSIADETHQKLSIDESESQSESEPPRKKRKLAKESHKKRKKSKKKKKARKHHKKHSDSVEDMEDSTDEEALRSSKTKPSNKRKKHRTTDNGESSEETAMAEYRKKWLKKRGRVQKYSSSEFESENSADSDEDMPDWNYGTDYTMRDCPFLGYGAQMFCLNIARNVSKNFYRKYKENMQMFCLNSAASNHKLIMDDTFTTLDAYLASFGDHNGLFKISYLQNFVGILMTQKVVCILFSLFLFFSMFLMFLNFLFLLVSEFERGPKR